MKILKPFTKWLSKTGSENKSPTSSHYSDYSASQDTSRDYLKEIYKKDLEWKKELRKRLTPLPTYNKNSNNINWANITTSAITAVTPAGGSILNINGSTNIVEVKTALEVNGRDILKELDEMRDALLLLKRDVNMESKYPKLKELKDQYEAELAKYKTFEALK
jgi:hypothetical protein